ncbi:acetyl/propionyl/methylcrotonyl-CoA carboxylase subunit alpha [Lewinella sp. IMCC34191]|uniref:acetyl-CoA carboxylase biotin carboxylase subunit n=1 Tax=Lewinella sp. IMCC34191 TaxID=2259172 RepID=UPI000E2316BD|nr:acetyl-CoA carboxylase biotin carboxylase subunit [Lewinella sp. IMCC34191]
MKKILVANRGEIALRIMRTARRMGIATVAVYSDADRRAPHVRFADEAVHLGPPPSSQSYLDMQKVIDAARQTGADGIHPGYGFLSENAAFARKVEEAGITFIGPRPHAIEVMGNKLAAKDTVSAYDIPMVPGLDEAVSDPERAKAVAKEIGFPILIKAAAGGGGKGMRIVEQEKELEEQMNRAISEAQSAFGDGSVFIEKYIASPKHIEIQVLADTHGNCVHLFERDCSVQRRHQKVVEEAPSAVVSPALRRKMGEAAVLVAKSCDYVGAGTVEFLLDADESFYFLEMNTRLQVEHPVTELITGIDLVEQQIRVARGEHLAFKQEDLRINGHALELRVYAEDPLNNFLPSIGTLTTYRPPADGARVDDGFEEGMVVPIHYDPMIAKLIIYGETRAEAIERMLTAIDQYRIEGIDTTLPFGRFVFQNEAFRSGHFDTNFVKKHYTPEGILEADREITEVAALFAAFVYHRESETLRVPNAGSSNWQNRH